VSQWVWNLRLEVGHEIEPAPVRTTAFAAAIPSQHEQAAARPPSSPRAAGYGPPTAATSWKTGRFTGAAFPLQPDGTLQCPAGQSLRVQQRRRERDGSLRVVYAASIRHCRACPLRQQCQWNGSATAKPRQVSVLLHPLQVGSAPLRLRTTGAAESTGAPACNSCATSAWR
jgi:DDE family transposase